MNLFPIAVLISGGGTTLKNLIHRKNMGDLPIDIRVVISSSCRAAGLKHAADVELPSQVISRKNFATDADHSQAIFEACRDAGVQLVVMGGYVEFLYIPPEFENRVINIHPSLIPSFCGKGFYGSRVHTAALEKGVKLSGCTVHYVDNQFDHGPIIAQRSCEVLNGDTPETLQRRVFELECQLYPDVIAAIAKQQIEVSDQRVTVNAII